MSDRIGISYIVLLYPIKEAVAREPDRRVHKEAVLYMQRAIAPICMLLTHFQ